MEPSPVSAPSRGPHGDLRAPVSDRAVAGDGRDLGLLHALSEAASEMHRSLSLDAVLRVATDRAREIVGARHAVTTETLDADGRQRVRAVSTARTDGETPTETLIPPDDSALYRAVSQSNRPLRLAMADLERRIVRPSDDRAPGPVVGTWMAAPLVGSDGSNLGLIQLIDRLDGAEFGSGDEAILVQLARMASVAIENARLYETAVEARTQLAWAARIERVRAAELRAVVEAIGEAILVCDGSGRVALVNPAADALFAGRPVQTFDDLLSRFAWAAETPPDPGGVPLELRLRDGPERWVELRTYRVPAVARRDGDSADVEGRIAVMRDITAARQARAQREAFLGILSHELRTPITTIYAGSKVLARNEPIDGATWRDLATDISEEAERLFRLVEDLLVITRVERGALQLANEPVLIQRVLASAIRVESSHWQTTRIAYDEPPDLPAVSGDATYVEQVIRNLLSNAAKYSPPRATVRVRLEERADEVVMRVLDRGHGFRSKETDDLFELFYRSPATAAQASGAGIGLFVCRRLIHAMGGRIWARPRPGGGAEFGFALRRYVEES